MVKEEYLQVEGEKKSKSFPWSIILALTCIIKSVMAFLIVSAEVMGEDRLEVTWKYQDVYEKNLAEMKP